MFLSTTLLLLILISWIVVGASPLGRGIDKATLRFATRINGNGMLNIVEKDRAHAHALKSASKLGEHSISVHITDGVMAYTAEVGVGSPATYYTLLVDIGGSNTWVGASKPYIQTSTSRNTGNNISVTYGAANFTGEEWIDAVTLGSGLVINNQSIGVAGSAIPSFGSDGVLGLGPVDLTSHTVTNEGLVPTVLDNLLSQGTISSKTFGIYYVPASECFSTGTLTFGGYDSSVITSPVNYVPLTTTSPASYYWGINQSVSYGGTTILSSTAGIVDTGTTLIHIDSAAFREYESATGGVLDSATGLLKITSSQYDNLKALSFHIGNMTYDLSPNAQIWPRSHNNVIGGRSNETYLVVADIGNSYGSGLDFIMGYTFLERYYSIFDAANQQVGFAFTAYTNAITN